MDRIKAKQVVAEKNRKKIEENTGHSQKHGAAAEKTETKREPNGPNAGKHVGEILERLNKDPRYENANADFLIRRLRLEFDKNTSTRECCQRNLLPDRETLQRLHRNRPKMPGLRSKSRRKRNFPSYTKMRLEREKYRQTLVSLIMSADVDEDESIFLNAKERQLLNYYHYIKHGIDTTHIAPMTKRMLNKILQLLPHHLLKWETVINENTEQIKAEYIFVSKKSVVDFVLGQSLDKIDAADAEQPSQGSVVREKVDNICSERIQRNRNAIKHNLYAVNSCLRHMLSVWQTTYTKVYFIDIDELLAHSTTFELTDFTVEINRHIEKTRDLLCSKWYDTLRSIHAAATRRKCVPDHNTKPKAAARFFDCVASQMTQCLQDIAIRSLHQFSKFMRIRSSPRLRLHILLEDEDRLVFSPTFVKIQNEVLHIVDNILNAVQHFDRIECAVALPASTAGSRSRQLKPIIPDDIIGRCRNEIVDVLEEERIVPEMLLQDFDDYMSLMNGNDIDHIYNFMNESPCFDDYCKLVNHYNDIEYEISINIACIISVGFYEFHRSPLIDTLEALAMFMQTELLARMVSDQQREMSRLQNRYEEISKQALEIPRNTAELMASKAYVERVQAEVIPETEKQLKVNLDHFLWLTDHTIYAPLEIKQNSITFQWYLKMPSVFQQHTQIVDQKTVEYQELLRTRIKQFRRDLDVYWEQISEYENWGDIALIAKYKRKATILDGRLTTAADKIKRINEEETSFGWELSQFELLEQTQAKLTPYKKLFDAGQDFIEKRDVWLKSQVGSYNPDNIGNDINVIYDDLLKLTQNFEHHPHTKRLADDVKTMIDEFKLNMPIIETLGNPGLKLRHWEQISEMVGFPITVSAELTLEKIIEFGLEDYLGRFHTISESATRENGLEFAMSEMVVEWEQIQFVVLEYRDTGTFILDSVFNIQTLLDDQIIKTQTMKNSPYIKPFETEMLSWEAKLVLLQEILDDWLRVQATWMYLEPVFAGSDIQQLMPEESRRFGAVDKIWKELMKQVHADASVMAVVEIDKMLEKLKKAFGLLETIQRGLNSYLDMKRLYFSRLFFLSNDGVLELLAETKDPQHIQPHLRKCFEGIDSLTFGDNVDVLSMKSAQGEEIPFGSPISTSKARGQVEKWLLELENEMKKAIFANIQAAEQSMSDGSVGEWISSNPGQCTQAAREIAFTRNVDLALTEPTTGCLNDLFTHIKAQADEVAQMLRSGLTGVQLVNTQNTLIQLKRHETLLSRLIEQKVSQVNDFEWLGQIRFYSDGEHVHLKVLTSKLAYGCEYVGNAKQLIGTAASDRAYRAIFVALSRLYGVAAQGPSAGGKTQGIKNLARIAAKYCVAFNCAVDFHCLVATNYLKGAIACGAWVCLDGLDHVSADNLSVIANQIQAIRSALVAGGTQLMLDSTALKLQHEFGIFATLTPSKSFDCMHDLPSNLKTYFRIVSITAPDLQRIIEIELLCSGYGCAASLAGQIFCVFELCRQQIARQAQYDFGPRAIQNVLQLCAQASRPLSGSGEDEIVHDRIRKVLSPSLLAKDAHIFSSILADVFPNIKSTDHRIAKLKEAISVACNEHDVQDCDYFVEKVMQLHDMLEVHVGVMIIGESFAGKTTAHRMLSTMLGIRPTVDDAKNQPTCRVINPKSVTAAQLYGRFDMASNEWKDGILARNFRELNGMGDERKKWMIFDGAVDSAWMDNIHSLLDDSRQLCLMSGDMIPLRRSINLIFEPLDLAEASPSVVSRCGVIHMSSEKLGWQPLLHSWKLKLPTFIEKVTKLDLANLFQRFCPILLYFIRTSCNKTIQLVDSCLMASLMNLFDCLLAEHYDEKFIATLTELDIRAQLEGMFFFACIWSLGAILAETSRLAFSELFHGLLAKEFPAALYAKFHIPDALHLPPLSRPYIFTIPAAGAVFDYRFICEGKGKWKLWSDEIASTPAISRDIPANQIIIPTKETIQLYALVDLLTRHGKRALLIGPTATGKSFCLNDYLAKKLDKNVFVSINMIFSAGTEANQVQSNIMERLNKRRKGVYGPSLGKKCVIFVDDLSLPRNRTDDKSQSAIELLRMLVEHSLWYDLKRLDPIKMIDLQIMCAMTTPYAAGSSSLVRFIRHFNVLGIDEFSGDTQKTIFSKIVLWHLDARGFSKEFDPCIDEVVLGTLSIYTAVRDSLLPTPSKLHYVFNLRDFSRIMQGVLLSVPEATEGIDAMRRLWAHEICRVYADRLNHKDDQQWLFEKICSVVRDELHTAPEQLLGRFIGGGGDTLQLSDMRKLLYCDFTNPKADTRNYLEVQDIEELRYVVESYLIEFNNMTKRPMNLSIFRYAVEHIARICRVFKQPRSHALLIGIGGIGRQSYTRLAAHIMDFELHQIELTQSYSLQNWTDFLKSMILKVSYHEQHGVFLIADAQLRHSQFLDDVTQLMATGEILHLFSADELADVHDKMLAIDKQRDKSLQTDGSPRALHDFFVGIVREQLHVVVCMSPANDRYRDILINYPTLLNACTIDYFGPWPDDALVAIAHRFMSAEDFTLLTDAQKEASAKVFREFHYSTLAMADALLAQRRTHIYIPPVTYIEAINVFMATLKKKTLELEASEKMYGGSLDRLAGSCTEIDKMQKSIDALDPQCRVAAEKITKRMADIQLAQDIVDEQRECVRLAKDELADLAAKADDLLDHFKNIMEDVIPQMLDADQALQTLSMADLSAVRTMKSSSQQIKMILETICILRDVKPDKLMPSLDDYWTLSKKLLSDPKFIEALLALEKDALPDHISERLQEKVAVSDAFDPDKIKLISVACEQLCKWVLALLKYDRAAKIAQPKRSELKQAEVLRDKSAAELSAKTMELDLKQASLSDLQKHLQDERNEHDRLKANFEQCSKRLQRATEIVTLFDGEKEAWQLAMREIRVKVDSLVGDVIVSSGMVCYLGQFSEHQRKGQVDKWTEKCAEFGLKCAPDLRVANVMADSVQLESWVSHGLTDGNRFAHENAVIILNTIRWPLIIDPEGFANKWIKSYEKENRLCVVQQSQADYLRVLENAMQYGLPVLVENVELDLDPIMEPILAKEVFRQSGSRFIKLGEKIVEYNDAFRIYITTKRRKPNHPAEISAKVAIVNFEAVDTMVESYLLGVIVSRERPDLEAENNQLITLRTDTNKAISCLENKILMTLSTDATILDNDASITLVSSSYMQLKELMEKSALSSGTEAQIDKNRAIYHPFAVYATIIYFTLEELARFNQMYQYSIAWFSRCLTSATDLTDKVDDIQQRIVDLKKFFTFYIYTKLCCSLRQQEKLLLSALLAKNIGIAQNDIAADEWSFIVGFADPKPVEGGSNRPDWISEPCWAYIERLSALSPFEALPEHISSNELQWQEYSLNSAASIGDPPTSDFYSSTLTFVQQLLLFHCFQPTKLQQTLQLFIRSILGDRFVEPQTLDLNAAFNDSTCCDPLLFILTASYDPMASIKWLAKKNLLESEHVKFFSMGNQRNTSTLATIDEAIKSGHWVILQNCHLASDWWRTLERICDNLTTDTTHTNFRLWLTTSPTAAIPLSLLHRCIKLIEEPAQDTRGILAKAFTAHPISDENWVASSRAPLELRQALYALTVFHATIWARRNYGAVGWNYPYHFGQTDLCVGIEHVFELVNDFSPPPYDIVRTLLAECIYGSRVGEFYDSRCLHTIACNFFSRTITAADVMGAHNVLPPSYSSVESIVSFIKALDVNGSEPSGGLHKSFITVKERNASHFIANHFSIDAVTNASKEMIHWEQGQVDKVTSIVKDIMEILPERLEDKQSGSDDAEPASLALVLAQEISMYNQLSDVMRSTLTDVLDSLKGKIITTQAIEMVAMDVVCLRIPDAWRRKLYPCSMALPAFLKQFQQKVHFMKNWMENGPPKIHWLPVFFSASAFLTTILRNHSCRFNVSFNMLAFDCVTRDLESIEPTTGCLINGLYLEGAAWCGDKHCLIEMENGRIHNEMATIYLKPTERTTAMSSNDSVYGCPVYKTLLRRGLSHPDAGAGDFITELNLHCDSTYPAEHWILRGCALICDLDN